jgi:hypothetical protein
MEPAATKPAVLETQLGHDHPPSDAFTPAAESMWKGQILEQIRVITGLAGWRDAEEAFGIPHDVCPDDTDGSCLHIGPCAHACITCYMQRTPDAKGKRTQADRSVHWIGDKSYSTTTLLEHLKVTMDEIIDEVTQESTDPKVRQTAKLQVFDPKYGLSFVCKGSKVSWIPSSLLERPSSRDTRCESATQFGFEPSAKRSRDSTAHDLTARLTQFWSAFDAKAGAGAGGGAAGGAGSSTSSLLAPSASFCVFGAKPADSGAGAGAGAAGGDAGRAETHISDPVWPFDFTREDEPESSFVREAGGSRLQKHPLKPTPCTGASAADDDEESLSRLLDNPDFQAALRDPKMLQKLHTALRNPAGVEAGIAADMELVALEHRLVAALGPPPEKRRRLQD